MALHDIFETIQLKAYFLAESDSFEKHPDVYWLKAEASVIAVGHKNPQRKTTKAKAMTKDKLTLIDGIGLMCPSFCRHFVTSFLLPFHRRRVTASRY